jgi:threonylcarbamoyladenosine tRNA methylthiotransferase MtaB
MATAAFTTLGCKVNQYETQRILESFEARGFTIVPFTQPADVYVINTCSVTQAGESKSRQAIRRAARQNPQAKVIATGCAGEMAARQGRALEAADLVVPNPDKLKTLDHLLQTYPEFVRQLACVGRAAAGARRAGRTRATVKLQDGCDMYCSYCSVPYTRPRQFSRPAAEVTEEVRRLAARGYREVVLTGVLIGSYGPKDGSGGPDLVGLVARLAEIDGIERIRLSSVEVGAVGDDLLGLMRREPKVCPHLHIPLQSGDDRVLRDMNRPYSRARYLDLCRRAQESVHDLAITTDIMVGFPTEDEEAFENTLEVVQRVGFLRAHVFRYSPRPGTPAAAMGDPVHGRVKTERSKRAAAAAAATSLAHRRRFLGREMRVLVERPSPRTGLLCGFTDNYIETHFAGPPHLSGQLVTVRLDDIADGITLGAAMENPPIPSHQEAT